MNILIDGQTLLSPEVNRGIGIYFKNVLNNMVKQSFVHNWYIAIGNREGLKALDPWVAERLIPVENEIFLPSTDYGRTEAYTAALEEIVESKNIDVFWDPNPMMVNVLFLGRSLKCRQFATMYDLIPAIKPIKEWSQAVQNEYQRRLDYLRNNDMSLVCISDATKKDFEQHICVRDGLYVTLLAADSRKFYKKRCEKKNEQVSIVFTGGFDYRKNMDGAVQAFAKLCQKYRGNQLVDAAKLSIVCNAPQEQQDIFYAKVKDLGVEGRVVLTGFIPDQELSDLYSNCDVFFFPSLYEGFGLPIVEAMLAGAYILSADNSSLPEVCGNHAILCNAEDVDDMAEKLMEALRSSNEESLEEKWVRQEYALGFSWEKTAKETLELFEACDKEYSKRKIALVTPWPKQNTGIANFVYQLMPYLSKYFDVDVYVDNTVISNEEILPYSHGKLRMIDQLDAHHAEYEKIIYQIGNSSEFHTGIYKKLVKHGGIAEIHDYILHPFFYHSFFLKKDYEPYRKALLVGYGNEGAAHYQKIKEKVTYPDNEKYPMSHSVANISEAVIFHNHWSSKEINSENTYIIPLACFDRVVMDEKEKNQRLTQLKKRMHYDEELVIGCFGFVNANKRPEVMLSALEKLVRQGYPVKLVFWGKSNYAPLAEEIAKRNLSAYVYIAGYMEKEDYEVALEFTDVVVNLRYPSMGESSGTLCEAFKYGKATIVSDLNQYQEYPDEVCWKVPVGSRETEILTEMLMYLMDYPEVREALGQNAKNYADQVLSPDKIAQMYRDLIDELIRKDCV